MDKNIKIIYKSADEQGDFEFGNIQSVYGATAKYFTKNGEPWLPITGEFHFSRYDNAYWELEIAKMKSEGLTGVAVYIFWNHHEQEEGVFDFSGDNDINKFLGICKKYAMNVVLRIGPWCHGEVRYGGFPDYLRNLGGKRKSTPKYMAYVERFWKKLYEQVSEYLDGETVLGIQLENEYNGSIDHIADLRDLAEKIGFKTPFFTMTKWPTNTPSKRYLPMIGGYPEAPWTQHKMPLKPSGRFAIAKESNDEEIGADLIKGKRKQASFAGIPMAGCEIGTGNQVTQHRRPVISDKDGYGVAMAKLASGVNWMGYYMYHGGRNPAYKPLQESRITCYPNNYPIIDYDFQAPISKDGKVQKHGDRLRLMHIFINEWDRNFAKTQPFFALEGGMPYISCRGGEGNIGYVFISNYERGMKTEDVCLDINLDFGGETSVVNKVDIKAGEMIFFPVNFELGGEMFDYIIAQPILKVNEADVTHAYFVRPQCGSVRISRGGNEVTTDEEIVAVNDKLILHFLDEDKALQLHYSGGKIYYAKQPILCINDKLIAELYQGTSVVDSDEKLTFDAAVCDDMVKINQIKPQKLKYNYYMYSHGARKFYQIAIDRKIFDKCDDVEVTLRFKGMNLQIFHNGQIVDDYFNTNGCCVFRLARLKKLLAEDNRLVVRACAKTRFGTGNPYNEISMKNGEIDLKLGSVKKISYKKI